MHLTEIDPNKKYVLVLPEVRQEEAERLIQVIRKFLAGDEKVMALFGADVTIVPADQVVGYTTFDEVPVSGCTLRPIPSPIPMKMT